MLDVTVAERPERSPGADGGGLVVGLGRQGVGNLAHAPTARSSIMLEPSRVSMALAACGALNRSRRRSDVRMRSSTSTPDSARRAATPSRRVGQGRQGARRRAGNGVDPLHGPFQASEPLLDAFEYRDQGRFGRAVLRGGRCAESRKVGHGASSGFACGQQRATLRGTSSATRVPVQRAGISRRPAGTAAFQLKR